MRSVRAFADRADAVERRNAKRCGKVAVRASSRRGFFQIDAELFRQLTGAPEESDHPFAPLQRRPVQTAGEFEGAALVKRFQRFEFALQRPRIAQLRDADIDVRVRLGRHDVRSRTAGDHSGIYCDPFGDVREAGDPLDLPSQFDYRAGAFLEIYARMRRLTANREPVISDALACSLYVSFKSGAGLQHQHGLASFCILLRQRARSPATGFFV